ncbi:MAG TPA: sigma-70 family RNA polymerase sigma factor [Bryobacteraceae bacterium]|nr:sigma-70 family RNA polymerase sigma factor [Bryobacteraceae bacterium]
MASSVLGLNSEAFPRDTEGCVSPAEQRRQDEELVRQLRAGEEAAYEILLGRFQQPVYNLALRLLNDPGDASDVVQEVFLKVFRNVGRFRHQSSLKTWIYRITVNEAHNQRRWFFRHRSREVGLDDEPEEYRNRALPDGTRSPFDHVFDREKHVLIEDALGRINPLFREAVVLREIEDLSYEEIADVLQISLGTVKSRIMRGREALRRELTARMAPEPALRWAPE